MKFDYGETQVEKRKRLSQWHRWFAWRPVKVSDHDCRWLETVERKGLFWHSLFDEGCDWEYRGLNE